MIVKVVTPTALEALTLGEVKTFLRVDGTEEDSYITSLITSARESFEAFAGRFLLTTVVDEFLVGGFPVAAPNWLRGGTIHLSKPGVSALTSVKYYDAEGTQITVPSDEHRLVATDSDFYGIEPVTYWPTGVDDTRTDAVTIRYSTGWAVEDVPNPIKDGMLLMIAWAYDDRANSAKERPTRAEFLWDKYRLRKF